MSTSSQNPGSSTRAELIEIVTRAAGRRCGMTTPVSVPPQVLAEIRAEVFRGGVEAEPSPEAVFWVRRCERVAVVAAELESRLGWPGVAVITEYDRITVEAAPGMAGAPDDLWQHVLDTLGVTETRVRGWFLLGDGEFEGEPVRLVGHGMVSTLAVSA
ncbi:hypothetical protein [Actinacidiphila sp. ITFR-21]|uniref:hypothetical protein n=1 Tax=Actinacidiphila sp. ITFR-21 TaxID=3075199 RepID=UPI002889EF01|nr:hypothetical protein [Streptomyces sp. ITFR-21]WNI19119.1 hypothetical protein RLT57_28685 [Streptomyces sp. ITFR-21]